MNEHQTPLFVHLKEKHLWKDAFFLSLLWLYVGFASSDYQFILIKLMALVASLEFLSFLSFHLFGKEHSLHLQGFLGGFISSTTVFIQLNYDKKFLLVDNYTMARSMLLAIGSMIIECIIIMSAFSANIPKKFVLPFIVYLLVIVISILILKAKSKNTSEISQDKLQSLVIDDPITWIKVLKFATYVAILKYVFFLSTLFSVIPKKLGIFIASLFEAHAVLAVSFLEVTTNSNENELFVSIVLILAGSSLSKLYFVLRGPVLDKKRLVVIPMLISLLCASLMFVFII